MSSIGWGKRSFRICSKSIKIPKTKFRQILGKIISKKMKKIGNGSYEKFRKRLICFEFRLFSNNMQETSTSKLFGEETEK